MSEACPPARLTATAAAAAIRSGALTCEALMRSCLDRIAERDDTVHAWAFIDPEAAMAAARRADATAVSGPLHGVPVGIKDVIETADMPTQYGSPAFAGNRTGRDARCVERLRAAGAIIVGKLVTAEFATYSPGPTANPLNPAHTPGGSSSGSAAAVADFQVPLALGTQTAGSMIRPASFCGIPALKPSFGRYSTEGALATAHRLDTIGVFARSVEDLALADAILAEVPTNEAATVDATRCRIGIYRGSAWALASAAMQRAVLQAAERLAAAGHAVRDVESLPPFDHLADAQALIHKREAWACLGTIRRDHDDQVSQAFRDFIDAGEMIGPQAYADASRIQDECRAKEAQLFDGVDLLLAPGAPGIAPVGLGATGDPAFSRMTTALGVPCLAFRGGEQDGLPLGLQLIGRTGADPALLASAPALIAEMTG